MVCVCCVCLLNARASFFGFVRTFTQSSWQCHFNVRCRIPCMTLRYLPHSLSTTTVAILTAPSCLVVSSRTAKRTEPLSYKMCKFHAHSDVRGILGPRGGPHYVLRPNAFCDSLLFKSVTTLIFSWFVWPKNVCLAP